jgi:molecular chaperone DnaK
MGNVTTVMIPRNTTIPAQKKETYSTASDNQTTVEIHVLQGERKDARYNRTLGKFRLDGLPPAPRGVPKVEVTFDIDANGILSVMAKDMATGKDQRITITSNGGLAKEEVDRMVTDAASHEEEDRKHLEEIERRNKLDTLCYSLERQISENRDKVPAESISTLEELVKKGREAVERQDDPKVIEILGLLEKEAHRMASKMYDSVSPPIEKKDTSGFGKTPLDAEFEEA